LFTLVDTASRDLPWFARVDADMSVRRSLWRPDAGFHSAFFFPGFDLGVEPKGEQGDEGGDEEQLGSEGQAALYMASARNRCQAFCLRVVEATSARRYRAMLALAHFCRNGEGTAHDPAEAKAWLVKVIENAPPKSESHREAKALLPKWETEML
jgi:hypothetical protein